MEMKFDPMTGEPIQTPPQQEPEMKFDPMTGQPIQTPPQQEPEMKFYHMTGQPIIGGETKEKRFDPMTGKPIQETGKASVPKAVKIAVIAVAAVAAVGIVAAQAVPRIVLGKNYKIVQAIGNTMESNHLMDNMSPIGVMASGKYTVTVDGSVENVGVEAALAMNSSAKKASLEGHASYMGFGVDMAASMDDSQVLVSIPELTDQTLRYSYVEEKNGYLIDLLEEEGLDTEQIDEAFCSVFSTSSGSDTVEEFRKASIKAVKAMDFQKADKRQVSIDGKNRKCQGYTLEIDGDLICDLCDIYEDAYDACMEDLLDETVGNPSELFDEIRDEAEDMEGDLTIYIYKKKVAAVVYELDGHELSLELHGGNTPWANATLEMDDEEIMTLSGSVKNKVEILEVEAMNVDLFSYEYNYKTGDLELSIAGNEIELEGIVKKSGKNCVYAVSNLRVDGSNVDMDGQITIQKGANYAKISEKDVFDIGNASESDWEELSENMEDLLDGLWY